MSRHKLEHLQQSSGTLHHRREMVTDFTHITLAQNWTSNPHSEKELAYWSHMLQGLAEPLHSRGCVN